MPKDTKYFDFLRVFCFRKIIGISSFWNQMWGNFFQNDCAPKRKNLVFEIDSSSSPNVYVEVLCTTASPCFEKKKNIEAAASVRFSRLPTASQPQCPHLVVPPPAQRMAPPAGVRSSTPCCLGGCWPSKQKKGCEKAEAASTHCTTKQQQPYTLTGMSRFWPNITRPF